jgi:hypothetical protein
MNNIRFIMYTHQRIPLLLPDRAQRKSKLKNNTKKRLTRIIMKNNIMKMKPKRPREMILTTKVNTMRASIINTVTDQEEKATLKEEEEVAEAATEVEETTEEEVVTNQKKMLMKMDSK